MIGPDVTAATPPPDDVHNPATCDNGRRAQPVPARGDVSGLDRGAQASYRDEPPHQHRPHRPDRGAEGTPGTNGSRRRVWQPGRIRVAGIGTVLMTTTEYRDAVDAVAVLLSRHGRSDPPAEAA